MLDEKYLQADYYWKKFPLYLRNSYGIDEWVNIFWSLLVTIDENLDEILGMLDIFSAEFIDAASNSGYDMSILDHLASFVGISREMTFHYSKLDGTEITQVNAHVKFTDKELLMVVKCRLVQYAYTGSYDELIDLYTNKVGLPMAYLPTGSSASVIVNVSEALLAEISPNGNLEHAFRSGLLTVQSMGIEYDFRVEDLNAAIWDESLWDKGWWI